MKRVIINLDEQEAMNLQVMLSKYGGKAPAYFKRLAQNDFIRECGGYKAYDRIVKEKPSKVELTDGQICEQYGGKVTKKNGIPYCSIEKTDNGMSWSWPLDDMKNGEKYLK